jgi:hypothetical protein
MENHSGWRMEASLYATCTYMKVTCDMLLGDRSRTINQAQEWVCFKDGVQYCRCSSLATM